VLGENPFRDALRGSAPDRLVKGRRVALVPIQRPGEARSCEIVFISASERRALREILDAVKDFNTLTVGDMEGFAESGGMISLMLEDGHVQLEINAAAAERVHLRISSRLLNLARIVPSG
jgi:hypothetical protein